MAAEPTPYEFSDLVTMARSELRSHLAVVIAELCNELELTAYIRATDGRNSEFFQREGHIASLTEQKWLILKLLDTVYG